MAEREEIFRDLLRHRTVFVRGHLDDEQATRVTAGLVYLEREDPGSPVVVRINNATSDLFAALTVYDAITHLRPAVETICVGTACGGGALVLAAGVRGRRFALPHARVMLHEPTGRVSGTALEIEGEARQLAAARDRIGHILAAVTGKPFETVDWDTRRPLWLTAAEAKAYGLIDAVLE